MTRYIDAHRDRFGVEPICRTLQVAPSSYYAARRRQPSARAVSDAELGPKVLKVFNDNYRVYGVRKIWRQLHREGIVVGRDRVARLMHTLGITGVVRARPAAPPSLIRPPSAPPTWSTASSPRPVRTSCG